jgi:hypothetical protein
VETDILTLAGLVGVTLVISVGKWLDEFREWLRGFTFWANPLRMLGNVLTCTISMGFVVGALWALAHATPWPVVVIMGGYVSLVAYATDEGLALMDAGVRKLVGGGMSPPPIPMPMGIPEKEMPPQDRPLTEDEAHAMTGEGDVELVRAARAAEVAPVQQGRLRKE